MHYAELKTLPAARLRAYARDILGVRVDQDEKLWSVPEGTGKEKVRALRGKMLEVICQIHKDRGDPVQGVPDEGPRSTPALVGRDKGQARVRVIIHPEEHQPEYVFIGVEADAIMVQREREVAIPLRFFEALRNAVQTIHEFDAEGEIRRTRNVPRYHYTVLEAPTEGAVA